MTSGASAIQSEISRLSQLPKEERAEKSASELQLRSALAKRQSMVAGEAERLREVEAQLAEMDREDRRNTEASRCEIESLNRRVMERQREADDAGESLKVAQATWEAALAALKEAEGLAPTCPPEVPVVDARKVRQEALRDTLLSAAERRDSRLKELLRLMG